MIGHVGKHLALNEIAPHLNNCGTCGLIGCSIEVFTKGRGNLKQLNQVALNFLRSLVYI